MPKPLKIIFMGTPDFAMPSLQALIDDKDFEVVAVITQEDKKVGRKQELTAPPIKQLAQKNNLPVFQPQKIKNNEDFQKLLKNLESDILVVVAYGQIIPKEILEIPKFGAVNVHPSLLPLYRGASPIEAALLHGDQETGVTIMKLISKMDAGPILNVTRLKILENDNAESLYTKLFLLGGKILPHVLRDLANSEITPLPQNESKASYCHKIQKEDGQINLPTLTAQEIMNRWRAYTPWPSIFLIVEGKRLKLIEMEIDEKLQLEPGIVKELSKNNIAIGTKQGAIIPKKLQLEGKKTMGIQEFLLGNRVLLSKLLTNPK